MNGFRSARPKAFRLRSGGRRDQASEEFRNYTAFRMALFRRVEGETLPLSVFEKETVRTADRQFSAVYARHFTAGSLSSGGCLFYIFWK